MSYEQSAVTMGQNSETLILKPFAMTWVLNTSFRVHVRLPRRVLCTKLSTPKTLYGSSRWRTPRHCTTTALDADEESEQVDQEYRSMIGSLLYLTATRSDIQFSVCLCARFQVSPRTSHRQAVKRIFRYFHHTPDFDL
jgi:hypothetical protein